MDSKYSNEMLKLVKRLTKDNGKNKTNRKGSMPFAFLRAKKDDDLK